MKVVITRKKYNDTHIYTHVNKTIIKRKGWFFPSMDIDVWFGEGATSHYISDKHNEFWGIDHISNPGAGSMNCSEIEISEDIQSSDTTVIKEE